MTERPYHLTTARSAEAVNVLAAGVDALVRAWEKGGQPPALADYLPQDPPELRKMVLIELIKIDLEYRWRNDSDRKLLESYREEFPELATYGVPCDLVFEEFHVRLRAGDKVSPDQYVDRFPEQGHELRNVLGCDPRHSSAIGRPTSRVSMDVGDTVDDFDLLASLGEGAFGRVFLARQRSMQRMVALKVAQEHGIEPQTLAQLDHPHIVRVYDERQLPDRGPRLLYMQFIPGGTLQSILKMRRAYVQKPLTGCELLSVVDDALDQRGQTPPVESPSRQWLSQAAWWQVVAWLGVRLAEALDYAHSHGVLHRDVKPANVLLDADAQPKLADFNISFCSQLEGASPSAFFGGSLPYMSPEQLEALSTRYERTADEVDARSDLYSLGVMLWELLVGYLPYGEEAIRGDWSDTLAEILRRRRRPVDPRDISAIVDPSTRPLLKVLLACMEPDPENRPSSGAELARRLRLCLLPQLHALLTIESGTWREFVLKHPYLCIVTAGLTPNILAGIFNYQYNEGAIVRRLDTRSQDLFANVSTFINALAFPLGGIVGIVLVARLVRLLRQGRSSPPTRSKSRSYALLIGFYAAMIGVVEWLAAGPIFPLGFHLLGGRVPPEGWLHFFASMSICGLIAAAYPYLAITLLGTRVFFPALVGIDTLDAAERKVLVRTATLSHLFVATAAAIPMLGVTLVAFSGSAERNVMGAMNLAAIVGFLLAFWLYQGIQRDLACLQEV